MSESLDVSKLKVAELKTELESRGLSTKGLKAELVERLTNFLNEQVGTTEPEKSVSEGVPTEEVATKEDIEPDQLKVVELKEELENRGLPTAGLKADLVERLTEAIEEVPSVSVEEGEEVEKVDNEVTDEIEPNQLKVTELKTELESRGLPTSGRKAELVSRLTEAIVEEKSQKDSESVRDDLEGDDMEMDLEEDGREEIEVPRLVQESGNEVKKRKRVDDTEKKTLSGNRSERDHQSKDKDHEIPLPPLPEPTTSHPPPPPPNDPISFPPPPTSAMAPPPPPPSEDPPLAKRSRMTASAFLDSENVSNVSVSASVKDVAPAYILLPSSTSSKLELQSLDLTSVGKGISENPIKIQLANGMGWEKESILCGKGFLSFEIWDATWLYQGYVNGNEPHEDEHLNEVASELFSVPIYGNLIIVKHISPLNSKIVEKDIKRIELEKSILKWLNLDQAGRNRVISDRMQLMKMQCMKPGDQQFKRVTKIEADLIERLNYGIDEM